MADAEMRHRPEEDGETVDPQAPPRSTTPAAPVVAGMWYVLAPLGVILLIIVLAFLYGGNRDRRVDEPVEPTTGVTEEATPGGGRPDPRYDSPEEEREYRRGKP